MSPTARAAQHRRPRAKRPRHRPVPPVADHQRRLRHHLRVGEPIDHDRVRRRIWPGRPARGRFVVATTRTGSSASASSAARTSRSSGSCAVLGATSTSGVSPSGSSMSRIRQLELHRPGHLHVRRPPPRILELRERRHQRQLSADPPVEPLRRRAAPRPPASRSARAAPAAARSSAPAATPATPPARAASAAAAPRTAKNGIPGSCTGYTCGISVARRTPGLLGRQRRRQR